MNNLYYIDYSFKYVFASGDSEIIHKQISLYAETDEAARKEAKKICKKTIIDIYGKNQVHDLKEVNFQKKCVSKYEVKLAISPIVLVNEDFWTIIKVIDGKSQFVMNYDTDDEMTHPLMFHTKKDAETKCMSYNKKYINDDNIAYIVKKIHPIYNILDL